MQRAPRQRGIGSAVQPRVVRAIIVEHGRAGRCVQRNLAVVLAELVAHGVQALGLAGARDDREGGRLWCHVRQVADAAHRIQREIGLAMQPVLRHGILEATAQAQGIRREKRLEKLREGCEREGCR